MRYFPTTHIVIKDPYFNSFTGFVHQSIAHQTSHGIVFEDIELDMNMMLGSSNRLQQGLNHVIAIRTNRHAVSFKRQCLIDPLEKTDDGILFLI